MNEYCHHVSGFFTQRQEAENALAKLVERNLPRQRLRLFDNSSASPSTTPDSDQHAGSNEVLKDVLVDGAVGAAVGTGIGVLAELALVAANVSLFVASPLIAPLAMLGWGASLGGFVGAAVGAGDKKGTFSDLVRDAIASGQVVLVAETRTEEETAIAREVIQASVGDCTDRSMV